MPGATGESRRVQHGLGRLRHRDRSGGPLVRPEGNGRQEPWDNDRDVALEALIAAVEIAEAGLPARIAPVGRRCAAPDVSGEWSRPMPMAR